MKPEFEAIQHAHVSAKAVRIFMRRMDSIRFRHDYPLG